MVVYKYDIGKVRDDQAITLQHEETGDYLQCQVNQNTGQITNLVNNNNYYNQDNSLSGLLIT